MTNFKTQSRALWVRTQSTFYRLATGGDWAMTQSPGTRRNLVWFWLDGFFASASDNIVGTYLVIYLLALGATQAQIGLMSSLSSLSAAVMLLPGAMLVERIGRRRGIVLIGGGWARLALLFVALIPLLFATPGPALVYLAIALTVSRDALANLSFPAWMSMTGDIVPIEDRGRYFSSRNFIMGVSGITMTLIAGQLITHLPQPGGYQVALLASFAIGSLSIYSFSRLSEKPLPAARPAQADADAAASVAAEPASKPERIQFRVLLSEMTTQREFMLFAITTAIWNFSLNIGGPFFSVHLVQNLHADAAMVGLTSIASSVATMLAQRKVGELNDRWGARRLTMISGLLIPIVPFLWAFIDAAWYVIPINLLSGLLWGAYSLASFNYLFMIAPADRLARFSALFQIIVTVSLAVGALFGSLIVTQWGYSAVFIASAIGRLVAALLFAWMIRPRKPVARQVPV